MLHRTNRSAGLLGLTLVLSIAATGCGSDDSDQATASAGSDDSGYGCEAAKGKTVGFSEPLPDPNFAALEQVITSALGTYGVKLNAVNANLDPGKQISDINTLQQQGVNVLIANPVDPNATKPAFDAVRAKNIPIVVLDTLIGGPYFTTVREDMQAASGQGAELLKQTVGEGTVGAIYGPPFAEVINWQKEGFDAKARDIGLKITESGVNQKITPEGAKAFADAWKAKHGADMKGIWTFNDTSAIGVAAAVDGTFKPAIVSINGQSDVMPLIKAGTVLATFAVPFEKTGQALAYAALAALCDREVPKEIVIPLKKIDKTNVAEFRPIEERVKDPFVVEIERRGDLGYLKID
jgi:ribose transport system substrate-binding protein